MYLSSIQIKNFRCFDDQVHTIEFNPGLTVLVGENDSGKSAILDAIKIVLGTTDLGWYRLENCALKKLYHYLNSYYRSKPFFTSLLLFSL